VREIAAVIYRDWRQRITNIGFVFWDLFVPVAYLALFGIGFERALATSFIVDGQPLDYTLPIAWCNRDDGL
jgi:ABC-2 type transport system permease protein